MVRLQRLSGWLIARCFPTNPLGLSVRPLDTSYCCTTNPNALPARLSSERGLLCEGYSRQSHARFHAAVVPDRRPSGGCLYLCPNPASKLGRAEQASLWRLNLGVQVMSPPAPPTHHIADPHPTPPIHSSRTFPAHPQKAQWRSLSILAARRPSLSTPRSQPEPSTPRWSTTASEQCSASLVSDCWPDRRVCQQ